MKYSFFPNARLMCTPGLKFNERKRTYPSDQSGAQFTKVFEVKSTNPRIKLTANEEIIDGVSWKGKVLTQTVQPATGRCMASTATYPQGPSPVAWRSSR